jgi:hypothetical protein
MKRLLALVLLLFSCAFAAAADVTFTSTLGSNELSAAGIDELTPAQVERLNALVERYKSVEVTREVGKAVEETRAKQPKRESGDDPKRIETRIIGEFNGWRGNSHIHFENGQIWRPSNNESYRHHKTVKDPKVVLEKSGLIGYWMNIDGFPRVRVKRVD